MALLAARAYERTFERFGGCAARHPRMYSSWGIQSLRAGEESLIKTQSFHVTARVLIASVFVGLGLERLLAAAGVLAAGGRPGGAGGLAFGVFELVAGLMIVVGWQVRWVALLMAAFLLVDAFVAHPFWRHAGVEQHGQLLHFLKNFSIIGGLLLLSWAASVPRLDARPSVGEPG
jgi:putative oxidoreductase